MKLNQPVRRRLSPEERRQEILGAARAVFSESGLSGSKMRDVAARAGITETHLYRHFGSKEQLYEEAVLEPLDEVGRRVVAETRELVNRPDSSRAELLQHFHLLCLECFVQLAPLLRAGVLPRNSQGLLPHPHMLFPKWRAVVSSVIADITGWEARSMNLDVMVEALMGVYLLVGFESTLERRRIDAESVAEQLAAMFASSRSSDASQVLKGIRQAKSSSRRRKAAAEGTGAAVSERRSRLTKAERRNAILEAARPLFCEVGLSGARSKELADRAGITEAFLYRHFSSKEEIYEEAVEQPAEAALALLAADVRQIGAAQSGVAFTYALNQRCLRFFLDHGATLATAMLSDLERSRRYYGSQARAHLNDIGQVIFERMGYEPDQVDPEVARRAIMGSQWGVALGFESLYPTADLDEIALHLTRLLTLGVIPKKR